MAKNYFNYFKVQLKLIKLYYLPELHIDKSFTYFQFIYGLYMDYNGKLF